MEEEHKYQREMEKRELERKAQVRKDRKGHNSVKKEELSLLIETCVVYWSLALKFEFGIPHNKLWIIIYLLSDVNLMIPNVSLGIVVAMGICKRI